ncbi:hypothetical protein EUGRSUZ_C01547 [Eucalyptus grandis]|uniref:Uncharacterized protein n=1 Tax=Eucalyptus grandis TaxID=71139 RepID=A0ACC3LDT6_EUCGR|nr:hypothetical protein EUGRSUZ_C01547 [Eucalyptus grandis]
MWWTASRRVVSLNLMSKGLGGLLSPHVGNLSFLRNLVLQNNSFRGEIPQSIGHLFRLHHLVLGINSFSGQMPTNLSQCSNLEILYLIDNQLVGKIPDELGSLSKLRVLGLSRNNLAGSIPHSIGNLSQLCKLSLRKNGLQGEIPKTLSKLYGLTFVQLMNNQLTGEIPLAIFNMSNILYFSVSNNQLRGSIPPYIGDTLPSLFFLDFLSNFFTGVIPPSLSNASGLHSISKCLVLERLSLAVNSFHGEIPLALGTLRGLQELDVSHNNLSGEIPSFLAQLTFLKYLNLSSNKLEGEVSKQGVFLNASAVFIFKNRNLCGGIAELNLPSCKSNKVKVIAIVTAVLSFFIWCLCLFIFWYKRKKLKKNTSSIVFPFEHKFSIISYKELFRASDGFSEINVIGKGSYGTIYKATTQEGGLVAVKVLNLGHIGASKSFISECRTLGVIRHRNLMKIVNVCSSMDYHGNDFKALLYEYMANGSLENWIHQGNEEDVEHEHEHRKPGHLGLMQRLDIAIDIASAIKYLHEVCSPKIVHGDLKPSNVLLDNEMIGRVGDSG